MADDVQLTTLVNRARKALDVLTRPIQWALNPAQLVIDIKAAIDAIHDAVVMLSQPPPGDVGRIRDLADILAADARIAERQSEELGRLLTRDLPDGMIGVAAGTTEQALQAQQTLADQAAIGLNRASGSLDGYASDLETRQKHHAAGQRDLADGLAKARSALDCHEVLGVPVLPDIPGTIQNISIAVAVAVSGVRQCLSAYEKALEDTYTLRRELTDANGFALLADRRTPAGWSVLDTAALTAQGVTDPDDAVLDDDGWAALVERLENADPQERARLEAALANAETSLQRAVIAEAIARGGTPEQVEFLAAALADNTALAEQLAALQRGTSPVVVQYDRTTCGSTTLLMLLTRHDPLLALWLLEGKRAPGYAPPFLADLTDQQWATADLQGRLEVAQQAMHDHTNTSGWPQAWGTLPYDAERVLNGMRDLTGREYRGEWIDDQDHDRLRSQLTRAAEAANNGVPIPLYVGGEGDWSDPQSLQDGIPRHVVLITGYDDGRFEIYDPADGEVSFVAESELLDGGGDPLDEFGNWEHPTWIGLPEEDS